MSDDRRARSLARILATRFVLIVVVVFALNAVGVGLYYGTDRRALAAEAVNNQAELMEAALEGAALPPDASVRRLYAQHPQSYAFALIDRSGEVLDAMNAGLIPPSAIDLFADDWITRISRPGDTLTVAGHEFQDRQDGLRMVFVMNGDPAHLVRWAYLDELYEHVWLPIVPLAVLLLGAGWVLIRRSLRPLSEASAWARDLSPGAAVPPPPAGRLPAEIADLTDATQRALDRLGKALDAETRRAAEVAHALRTPVAVLTARLDALPPGETADQLRADVTHLSRTVQQVLAAARADGMQVVDADPLDLRVPAETATSALVPFAYEKKIELSLETGAEPVLVYADAEAVDLAVTNLIENAVVHGGAGPVVVTVGPGPVITVRDAGPGLPPQGADRLFETFWRAPDAAPGGTGLGLSIVERLQEAQGGTVEAEDAQGGGALFRLTYRGV
ncbi:HAMP domain-containing sensor histidine kinase [Thalassococcus sp. S3]|uniref:sensor histidine kinase n=1 Tax=Thalassococcus sp. S3 TaxID=2017482 RepID=UPI001023FA8D|nr:HAMP domain-containing sensor histidine kinase [Thalassococcus sp. S3]QBF33461.1 histidine kinase [Thalassococcus sp. S3]